MTHDAHVSTTSAPSRAHRFPRSGGLRKAGRPSAAWAAPAVLFFGLFALVPLVVAIYLSFTSWNGIRLSPPQFVGLQNWARLAQDPQIIKSLGVTVALVVVAVVTQTPLSILIGTWAAGPQRIRGVVVAVYFIPLLISSAGVTVLFAALIDPNFGIPAALPWLFGSTALLNTQWSAVGVIAFIYLWGATPLHSLIYQGAARAIPPVLYQAAAIDGAGRFRQFFNVTLPQLRNTIITDVILIVVGTFTAFDIILILTGGGPNQSTAILPFYMYEQGFQSFNIGYGSVVALILVALSAGVSIVMARVTGYDRMSGTQEGI